MPTILRLNQAAFLTVPKSESMSEYVFPDVLHEPDLASIAETIGEAVEASIKAKRLYVGIFDDKAEKGRFQGREVVLADGATARTQGQCGIRLWGTLEV